MADGDRLTAALDEIRAHAVSVSNAGRLTTSVGWHMAHETSARDVPRLLAAVDRVLAIHAPTTDGTRCSFCLDAYDELEAWPCFEYRAIAAALLGEEPAPAAAERPAAEPVTVASVWPPGCDLAACTHHYNTPGPPRGCICPQWFDSGGTHIASQNPRCTAHQAPAGGGDG